MIDNDAFTTVNQALSIKCYKVVQQVSLCVTSLEFVDEWAWRVGARAEVGIERCVCVRACMHTRPGASGSIKFLIYV